MSKRKKAGEGAGGSNTATREVGEALALGGTLTLRCKGDETLTAHALTLAGASHLLRDTLSLPLAQKGELGLEEDDAATWATALRMLDPKSDSQAALLSWANLEPVLRLADKYDSAVLRAMCVAFMTCNQADIKLEEPLTASTNTLIAATLLEQCCGQPELEMYTKSINAVVDATLTAPTDYGEQKGFLGKLKGLLTSPQYMKLVSPTVQARVMAMLVSIMESVMAGPPCCTSCRRTKASQNTVASVCNWRCACGVNNNS